MENERAKGQAYAKQNQWDEGSSLQGFQCWPRDLEVEALEDTEWEKHKEKQSSKTEQRQLLLD